MELFYELPDLGIKVVTGAKQKCVFREGKTEAGHPEWAETAVVQ